MTAPHEAVRERRRQAAERYRPGVVDTLLVAEAPPACDDRYFYFERVQKHDDLFRNVVTGVLGVTPNRGDKSRHLAALRDRGVFLIDLYLDPAGVPGDRAGGVASLVERVRELAPRKVILIKATVHDEYGPLVRAGVPVVDVRVPFPGSGHQREFDEAFTRASAMEPPSSW